MTDKAVERLESRFQQAEEWFRTLFIGSPIGLYIVQDGKFQLVNPRFRELTGYSEEELLGADPLSLVLPQDRDMVRENAVSMLKGKRSPPYEYRIANKGGEVRWIMETVVSIHYQGRRATLGNFMDITERKRAEEALRESEERLHTVVGGAPVVLWALDSEGVFTLSEGRGLDALGLKPGEVVGRSVFEVYRDVPQILEDNRRALAGESFSSIVEVSGVTFESRYAPIRDHTGEVVGVIGVATDITEQRRAEETIRWLAYHDAVTGLPNRLLFNDRLTVALAHARRGQQRLAVMLLDLDRFKDVNDTLGHNVGDQLLQAVGARLTKLLRQGDTVARLGGDEFLLLLPETAQAEDAAKVAQRILEAVRKPFALDAHQLHITTSIGIALYPDDGEDADALIRNADIAMYRAKEAGRDNYQRYLPATKAKDPKCG